MCGLCGFAALAITIGVYVSMVPSRGPDVIKMAVKSGIAGNIACFLTACVAGMIYYHSLCCRS